MNSSLDKYLKEDSDQEQIFLYDDDGFDFSKRKLTKEEIQGMEGDGKEFIDGEKEVDKVWFKTFYCGSMISSLISLLEKLLDEVVDDLSAGKAHIEYSGPVVRKQVNYLNCKILERCLQKSVY